MKFMKKSILGLIIVVVLIALAWYLKPSVAVAPDTTGIISSYEECVEAGNPIAETYPPQCRAGEEWFVLDVGNFVEKLDEVHVVNPSPQETIPNNYLIHGSARGYWFFEANTSIQILDENEDVIYEDYVIATEPWMTEEMVKFEREISFDPMDNKEGYFVFKKANASGLPEHDDEVRYPIKFGGEE